MINYKKYHPTHIDFLTIEKKFFMKQFLDEIYQKQILRASRKISYFETIFHLHCLKFSILF